MAQHTIGKIPNTNIMLTENQQGSSFEPTENLLVASETTPERITEESSEVVTAAVETTEVPLEKDNANSTKVQKRYTITGAELLRRPLEPQPFLVEGLIHRGCLVGLTGSSETGKSTLARDFCYAVVTGQTHYLGRQLNAKHQNVIYVSSEDNLEMMQEYLHNRLKGGDVSLLNGFRVLEDCSDHQEKLIAELRHTPADLVVIDVFADLFTSDINSAVHVRNFLDKYQRIANETKATFLIAHHTGKRTEKLAPSKNNTLGSQGFESKMRLSFELRLDQENDDRRHLCIVKANYLRPEEKKRSILLHLNGDRSYTYVGEGVELDRLAVSEGRNRLDDDDVQEIIRLHSEGKSCREIERILKQEGVNVGKTKINDIIRNHNPSIDIGVISIKRISKN